jgi:hemolysin activation/secretion protein
MPGSVGSLIGPPPPVAAPDAIDPGDETVISGTVDGLVVRIQPASHPGLPTPEDIDTLAVPLALRDGVWQPAPAGADPVPLRTVKGQISSASASVISKVVLAYFRERRIDGVVARVVAPEPGKKAPLLVAVMVGTVSNVRTRAIGADGSESVDAPDNARIATNSPLQANAEGGAATLLRQEMLEDYLFRLNRMPGRQVSSDIVPGDLPGTVTLDYLLQERRMFTVQLQGSNTGTEQNGRWIEQLGIIGTRILNLDDVLDIRGATNTFDGVYSISGSWEGRMGEIDQLRWRASGDWSSYDASDVGIQGNNFTGVTWGAGGALAWNFVQVHDLFIDLEAGCRGWYSDVDQSFGTFGSSYFVTPYGQLNFFSQTRNAVFSANVGFEWTGASGSPADLTTMGRLNPSAEWWTIRGDAVYTTFLDQLCDPNSDSAVHQITARVGGQWIPGGARATPVAQNVVGGFYTVRGYAQALSVGDNTVAGSLQYDFHVTRALPASPAGEIFGKPFRWTTESGTGMPPSWDVSPHVFFDAGYTSTNGPTVGELSSATLTSVGIGVTAMVGTNFSITVDWGIALQDVSALGVQAGDSQVWFVGSLSF